jgi:hypothetical protein
MIMIMTMRARMLDHRIATEMEDELFTFREGVGYVVVGRSVV